MNILRILLSFIFIFTLLYPAAAGTRWINNITVNEYNITWNYSENISGIDSINYKKKIDSELGNNDSFINAWELLKADKEARKFFRNSIENESNIRINNETSDIELIEVDSSLSQAILGKINVQNTIENRFSVAYRLKDSILNSSSIWFLGEPGSKVTIILPAGIDAVDISGMDNITKNIDSYTTVAGAFHSISKERGEIFINLTKNQSYAVNHTESNITQIIQVEKNDTQEKNETITKSIPEKSKYLGIIGTGVGIGLVILIYAFKLKKK